MISYDPRNRYWIVGGDETRAWSSAARGYVDIAQADPERVTRIESEVHLQDVLLRAAPDAALDRAFTAGEIMAALDVLDHGRVAAEFSAGEIAQPSPSMAARLRTVAASVGFAIGAIDGEAPLVPASISDRQFFQQLAIEERISTEEALAAVKTGAIPAPLQVFVDELPPEQRFNAEMLLSGATVFERAHPLTAAIGAAQGMTAGEIDNFFREAAAL